MITSSSEHREARLEIRKLFLHEKDEEAHLNGVLRDLHALVKLAESEQQLTPDEKGAFILAITEDDGDMPYIEIAYEAGNGKREKLELCIGDQWSAFVEFIKYADAMCKHEAEIIRMESEERRREGR